MEDGISCRPEKKQAGHINRYGYPGAFTSLDPRLLGVNSTTLANKNAPIPELRSNVHAMTATNSPQINALAMVGFFSRSWYLEDKASFLADIDECALKLDDCAENEVCGNGIGYYYCEDPNNPETDLDASLQKCPEGYTFNADNMVCDGGLKYPCLMVF